MPAQTQTNATAVKLGTGALAANAAAAKSTATIDDQGRLPDGIENGVARIVDVKIMPIGPGKKNSGRPMFNAQAVVVKPEFHNGVKVAGRRTSMMEMMFDTPESAGKRKTIKDHYDHVYAYLRMWGIDTNMFLSAKTEGELSAKLAAAFAVLVKKKTTISFRTYTIPKRKPGDPGYNEQYDGPNAPPPRVNETWGGLAQVLPDAAPPEAAVKDDSGTDDVPADAEPGDDVPTDDDAPDGATDDAGATELTDEEVDALVALADGEDEGQEKDDAGVRLEDWAKATCPDMSEEDRKSADNWEKLVEWVRAGGKPADEAGVAVGGVVKYKTPSAPGRPSKTVQCEVKKLYKVKGVEVADVLNLTDKKTVYKAVPADKLDAV